MKTAIVIGSTGAVGKELVQLLLRNKNYSSVVSLVRRGTGISHPKLQEHIVDFNQPLQWRNEVKGDVLFSAMGTTLKQAKSKDNQHQVDFTYQYETAKIASEQKVPTYVLVSAAGANSNAVNFYSNMKGELEDAIKLLPFNSIQILRPGQIDGIHPDKRKMEKLGLQVMYAINKIGLFRKFRPIKGVEVAEAMICAAEKSNSATYSLDELFLLKSSGQ